jgi:hypothetical protein
MLTIGEAIQRVQSQYSKGVQSQDSRLTDRHIYSALITARSTFLRQQANKKQRISGWMYQVLPCVELILAPVHECPAAPSGMTILRSKHQLPSPITGLDSMLIKSVTTLDGKITIDETQFHLEKYAKGNKYTAKKPTLYIRNRYMYITVLKILKTVPVEGLYDDPLEAYHFPMLCDDDIECEDCGCISNYDYDFPVDGNLMDTIAKFAANELLGMFLQMTEDKSANSSDDNQKVNMVHQQPSP